MVMAGKSQKTWQERFGAWAHEKGASANRIVVPEARLSAVALMRVLAQHPTGAVLVATADAAEAEALANSLEGFRELLGDGRPVIPVPEVAPGRRQWMPENEASRCAALQEAVAGTNAIYLASAGTLLSQTLSPKGFAKRTFSLKKGEKISLQELSKRLVELDYDHEFEVNAPGEFATRGGIVDIFSPLYADPVRMEFWGDEIDSMRFFSAETQCSTEPLEEFRVIPRGTAVLNSEPVETTQVMEYFPSEVPMVLCMPGAIEQHLVDYWDEAQADAWRKALLTRKELIAVELPPLLSGATQDPDMLNVAVLGEELNAGLPDEEGEGMAVWHWQQLKSELLRWNAAGYELVACCAGEGEIERFQEMLAGDAQTAKLPVKLEHRTLTVGVLFPSQKLALLSDQELFGRKVVRRRRRHIDYHYEHASPDEVLELEEGELAVHVNYGICRYHGICLKEIGGERLEALELEFAEGSRIYVPLDQSFLVSRYVGGTKREPSLSRLGSGHWGSTLEKAENAAWDLAAGLIRLEAVRNASPGFQFQPAVDWERAFASSFPFALTKDQEEALEACYQDMAAEKPMDRLLCGDVGYGKTEVALRAAFRAVMNNKQVAVLVPTTVLAEQHYQTFTSRLAEFPVRVEVLSRFRTAAEQHAILSRLAGGELDIVVGTHRLVSSDVRFANLGLVIIDEEQRFGVRHKQKLKELRASVDVLTMTATPIPRTLYLSLSGLRNLSTIMTAPANRLPVNTIVANYDEVLITEAITRELERGGQVFFLHNRVHSIRKVEEYLQQLVPQARIAVAHGRMEADELEEVMTDFVKGKSDVLLCTTIIESGIDIPNANTIIIDHAERFGLSELYQLRGRVGRYFRQAYAYMLLPPMGILPRNAQERMAAIKRFTHLGAGFRLAMKDMEIRGAGNLLGTEQSGHIAAVGFDLYCDLLKAAVGRLQNQPVATRQAVPVELDMVCNSLTPVKGKLQATIPPEYIDDETARVGIYKHLNGLTTPEQVENFGKELADRFGALPEAVKNLLSVHRIQTLARSRRLVRVSVANGRVVIETQKGLFRRAGTVPTLFSRDPKHQLQEIEELVKLAK